MLLKLAFVNFPAVADAENKHHEPVVLERADDAVGANSVFPELAERALQSCSDLSRILQFFDALVEKIQNSARDWLVKFVQLFQRGW